MAFILKLRKKRDSQPPTVDNATRFYPASQPFFFPTKQENGCCPDGITKAKGPNFRGCQNATPCKDAEYGCCDDLLNPAHGPDGEGCCLASKFGCCEDNVTPAQVRLRGDKTPCASLLADY